MGKKRSGSVVEIVGVTRLEVRHVRGEYVTVIELSDGFACEMRTDNRVGTIMSAFSAMLKGMAEYQGKTLKESGTALLTGDIVLKRYAIQPLTVYPYAYRLVMDDGRFSYTANLDRVVEHVILGYAGAMKFFATKYGRTVLEPEVIRNTQAAHELGFQGNA